MKGAPRGCDQMVSPTRFVPNLTPCNRTRREFLWEVAGGFAGLALIDLLSRDGFFTSALAANDEPTNPLAPKEPHFAAKAKHVVFLVMNDPRGGPISGASNWTAGFMPAAFQGTLFRGKGSPLLDLATPQGTSDRSQRTSLDLLKQLNEEHQQTRPGDSELAARIESY